MRGRAVKATSPEGPTYSVTRRWMPWRRRVKGGDLDGGVDFSPVLDFADDGLGLVILALVGLLALALGLPALLLLLGAAVEITLLLTLLPVFVVLRGVFGVSWEVEVRDTNGGVVWPVVHTEEVHGWRASGARINELADQIRVGSCPWMLA